MTHRIQKLHGLLEVMIFKRSKWRRNIQHPENELVDSLLAGSFSKTRFDCCSLVAARSFGAGVGVSGSKVGVIPADEDERFKVDLVVNGVVLASWVKSGVELVERS